MSHVLHRVKVTIATTAPARLAIPNPSSRKLVTNGNDDPIVVVWTLMDSNIRFDASGFFSWLGPVPDGIFSEPVRSLDGKRIVMDVSNPADGSKGGGWEYKLRATTSNGTHYETLPEEDGNGISGGDASSARTISGGGNQSDRPVSNPAIINR